MEAERLSIAHSAETQQASPNLARQWTPLGIAWFAALIGWTTLVAFYDLDGGARFEPTDAWVAQTAREMRETGNWIVPQFSGEIRLQKSPGPYWAVVLVSIIRGTRIDEVCMRIPNAIAAVVVVATVFWLTRRVAGERAALFAGFAASSSGLILYWSHEGASDLGLTACLTVSMATLWAGTGDEPPGRRRVFYWMIGYFTAGLGMLYKLPMPLACVGVPALVYVVLQRKWRVFASWWHLVGLLLFLLPWLPWVVMVVLAEPTVLDKWRVEFWDRFTGDLPNVEAQKNWTFYFLYLVPTAIFTFPYTLSLPGAFVRAFRERQRYHTDGILFVVIWFVSLFVFFTIAAGKETRYLLPALPPLFVLLGIELAAFFDPGRLVLNHRIRVVQISVWILVPAGLIGGGWAMHRWAKGGGLFTWEDVWPSYTVVAAVFGIGCLAAAALYRSRRSMSFATLVATMLATFLLSWSWLTPTLLSQRPALDFSLLLRDELDPSLRPRIAQIAQQDPRIIWYSDVRFPRVVDQIELLKKQGGKRSLEMERKLVGEAILRRIHSDELALFVANRKDYLTFLIEAKRELEAIGQVMPRTHLWLQTRIGGKKHQNILFGSRPPPWPEPVLAPPSERLSGGDNMNTGVEPRP